jgi:nitrate reductase gamma subunit
MLLLLLVITGSGIMMSFLGAVDVVTLKAFMMDLITTDSGHDMPSGGVLMIHLALVSLLAIIFPFSKLLHAPGIFFSPTRNQVDNPREQRHIVDWAKELETQ